MDFSRSAIFVNYLFYTRSISVSVVSSGCSSVDQNEISSLTQIFIIFIVGSPFFVRL